MGILSWILSGNEREVARLRSVVERINGFEPELEVLSEEQLRAKTDEFRARLAEGETLDDILPEAFAAVREASKRTTGLRHFDVQMIGGIVLHQGRIAEMKTGEGKTLVATLPLYLNGLEGRGAHLVTVNDYLAKFHAQWMGPIYDFLGLSVGALQGSNVETGELEASYVFDRDYVNEDEPVYRNLRRVDKRVAYMADVTYGTNHIFGWDYLRDNLAFSTEELCQRELRYAIVDEVDSILIDEARTPLIISGQAQESAEMYYKMDRVVARLSVSDDYTIDEKARTSMLTDGGIHKVEQGIGVENLADDPSLMHHANAALRARFVYKRDVDYVVRDSQVIIVDEFTGRLMFGRRWGDGLHQAVEAKEGVKIEHESQTLAKITYQNYFRLYDKLAGMTGTAKTEEEEFRKIYGLDVVVIPTNKPMVRTDLPDIIYKSEEAKYRGITAEILTLYCRHQPVLVGTRSIEKSEVVSSRLSRDRLQLLAATFVLKSWLNEARDIEADKRRDFVDLINTRFGELTLGSLRPIMRALKVPEDMLAPENIERFAAIMGIKSPDEVSRLAQSLAEGVPHNVLNAKYHEREAQIIADAGRLGIVTIATNMAGRGVDIILGGKPEGSTADRNPEAEQVVDLGGLAIVGTERHESRRIDNQLRGRSGRQGDPGCSRFFCSLEDELWRVFGDKSKSMLLGSWQEDEPIDWRPLSKMIELTQKRMESYHFSVRKHVLQYDDVMNVQREVIYSQRRKILEGADLKPTVVEYLHTTVRDAVNMYSPEGVHPSEWDTDTLFELMDEVFPLSIYARPADLKGRKRDEIEEFLCAVGDRTYEDREKQLGDQVMRDLERQVALRAVNNKWVEHLDAMDYLEEGIGMRGYAGIDPVVAFKKEAYDMFQQMLSSIQDEILRMVYRVQVRVAQEPYRNPFRNITMYGGEYIPAMDVEEEEGDGRRPSEVPVQRKHKVGRNDPCPCGSGKKYKKCCLGREV